MQSRSGLAAHRLLRCAPGMTCTAFTPRPQPERAFHHLTQPPPTWADTIAPFALSDARQQQAGPAHVDALPDPQFQFAVAFAREVGEQRGGGHRGAAGGGIFGKAARAREKHPRLQVERLLGCGTSRV